MPRENVDAKARRYICEGRLRILVVTADRVRAECRGAGAMYRCGSDRGGAFCTCEARGRCCHLTALMLVTDPVSIDA